jgi:hypothetical protein
VRTTVHQRDAASPSSQLPTPSAAADVREPADVAAVASVRAANLLADPGALKQHLNRGGWGTKVEIHPINQDVVLPKRRRDNLRVRRLQVRYIWDAAVDALVARTSASSSRSGTTSSPNSTPTGAPTLTSASEPDPPAGPIAGPRRVPGSSRLGVVDRGSGSRKQVNTAPVGHGVLYASRSTKVPCSSLHHLLSLLPRLTHLAWRALVRPAAQVQVRCLVAEFESVTDPRGACGVRYRISSLLALVVCAMTAAGHDSITAAAEWCRRATPQELAAFGLPYHPLPGRYRVPSEKTPRSVLGRLDPGEISAAGHDYLRPQLSARSRRPDPVMPDGGIEREQRRAHRAATRAEPARSRRRAIAVDGKCLRGAKRSDGSRVFVLSAVRHG